MEIRCSTVNNINELLMDAKILF